MERRVFGGACVTTGGTPTETLVAGADAAHGVRRAAVQRAAPRDSRVRAEQHVGGLLGEQAAQQPVRRRGLPEELVDPARRAVTHEEAVRPERDAQVARQRRQPRAILGRRMRDRVGVADAREVVVARVGVTAVAVGGGRRDRLVVVAPHDAHAVGAQQREHAIGVRTEAAEVAEAKDGVGVAPARVGQDGGERLGVRVHAAEDRDAATLAHALRHVAPCPL